METHRRAQPQRYLGGDDSVSRFEYRLWLRERRHWPRAAIRVIANRKITGEDMMTATFFRLDSKVAMVTGGGQGIGASICQRLAAAGAKVAVFDRDAARAQRTAHEIGGLAVAGDITSETDVDTALDEIKDH